MNEWRFGMYKQLSDDGTFLRETLGTMLVETYQTTYFSTALIKNMNETGVDYLMISHSHKLISNSREQPISTAAIKDSIYRQRRNKTLHQNQIRLTIQNTQCDFDLGYFYNYLVDIYYQLQSSNKCLIYFRNTYIVKNNGFHCRCTFGINIETNALTRVCCQICFTNVMVSLMLLMLTM